MPELIPESQEMLSWVIGTFLVMFFSFGVVRFFVTVMGEIKRRAGGQK